MTADSSRLRFAHHVASIRSPSDCLGPTTTRVTTPQSLSVQKTSVFDTLFPCFCFPKVACQGAQRGIGLQMCEGVLWEVSIAHTNVRPRSHLTESKPHPAARLLSQCERLSQNRHGTCAFDQSSNR